MTTEKNADPGARVGVQQQTTERAEAGTSSVAEPVEFDARRRAAARRLPPLDHGTGDPLDRTARESLPEIPRNWQASRRAWVHLIDHGFISEEALRDPAARDFWLKALGVAA